MRQALSVLSSLLLLSACSPMVFTPAPPLTTPFRPAELPDFTKPIQTQSTTTLRNNKLFPIKRGYRWEYNVNSTTRQNPLKLEKSVYQLEIDKVENTTDGTRLDLRSGSTPAARLLITNSQITLQDTTFLGYGAAAVQGLNVKFLQEPLAIGEGWEDQYFSGKVRGTEKVEVPAGTYEAWRVEIIGTYGQSYTAVGDYWIAPGVGIVKAIYNLPDAYVDMRLTKAGLRQESEL